MGGTDDAEKLEDKTKYYCIHNLINASDIVPLVAPQLMGFKRYGVDHYIPGTEAGEVISEVKSAGKGGNNGPERVTTYRDNELLYIKDNNRAGVKKVTAADKEGMLKQLRAIDSGIIVDDYFHPMAMDIIPPHMYEEGEYGGTNLEDFLSDFLRFAQEGQKPEDSGYNWSQAVKNRDKYVSDIQPALRNTLALVFTMSPEDSAGFIGRASTIINKFNLLYASGNFSLYDIYTEAIQNWHNLPKKDKNKYITQIWKKLEQTGAFDYLSSSDKAKLEDNWPLLAEFIMTLVHSDYGYCPGTDTGRPSTQKWARGAEEEMMYLPTFATYASYILMNHYPELNLAWARYYDSYYDDDTKEFQIVPDKWTVSAPAAKVDGEKIAEGEKKQNTFTGSKKVVLENEDIVGEAIYYDLKDNDTGEILAVNQIYRGGVDLGLGDAAVRSFMITAYAISYGVHSEEAVYNVKLRDTKHTIIYESLDDEGNKVRNEYRLEEGQETVTEAGIPYDKDFDVWKVNMLDKDGNVIDYYDEDNTAVMLLGRNNVNNPKKVFKVATSGSFFPEGYGLLFKAQYINRIKAVSRMMDWAPVSGKRLPDSFSVEFNNEEYRDCPVVWTYTKEIGGEARVCPAYGEAYDDTVYTATVLIDQDKENGILFTPEVTIDEYNDSPAEAPVKVKRNAADGSLRVTLTYNATEDTGENPKPEADSYRRFRVGIWDTNLEDFDGDGGFVDYYAVPEHEIAITYPESPGERFGKWDLGTANISHMGGTLTDKVIVLMLNKGYSEDDPAIKAECAPVLSRMDVDLYDEAGDPLQPKNQAKDSVKVETSVTISNTYEIDPDDLKVAWSPDPGEGGSFRQGEKYTATVKFKESDDQKIGVRIKGSGAEYKRIKPDFYPADDMKVFSNGVSDGTIAFHAEDGSVTRSFHMTPLSFDAGSAYDIKDVTGLPHGVSKEEVMDALQKAVVIVLSNNDTREVPVKWLDAEPDKDKDSLEEITWTVSGKLELPDDIAAQPLLPPVTDVTAHVTVNEADHTSAPSASVESGEYYSDQIITLSTNEKGGKTYFTTDGQDPAEHGKEYKEGQEIHFRRDEIKEDEQGEKSLTVKAYTKKDGNFDSAVTSYEYVFSNDISLPAQTDSEYDTLQQVIVPASRFYTIEDIPEGVTIDAYGNATAVDAGTYKVRLKLTDKNYNWIHSEEDSVDGQPQEPKRTTEDQIFTFRIYPLPIRYASVSGVKDKIYTGKARKQNVTVSLPAVKATLTEGKDYTLTYKNNVKPGIADMTVNGQGNFSGTRPSRYKITVKAKLKSAKAKKGRKAVIKWKKAKAASGYQIRYSTDKKFKKGVKKVTIKKAGTTKKILKKLKAGRKYYVQIRTFNKFTDRATKEKMTIYGSWTKSKKFKAKK